MEEKTLEIGTYIIPAGCRAVVNAGKVEVRKSNSKFLGEDEYRCKDCIYYADGEAIRGYTSKICLQKPKLIDGDIKLYYAASKYGKPCKYFKLKVKKYHEKEN